LTISSRPLRPVNCAKVAGALTYLAVFARTVFVFATAPFVARCGVGRRVSLPSISDRESGGNSEAGSMKAEAGIAGAVSNAPIAGDRALHVVKFVIKEH
jgi:hypothetical protein